MTNKEILRIEERTGIYQTSEGNKVLTKYFLIWYNQEDKKEEFDTLEDALKRLIKEHLTESKEDLR